MELLADFFLTQAVKRSKIGPEASFTEPRMKLSALTPRERKVLVIAGDLSLFTVALLLAYALWSLRAGHPLALPFIREKAVWFLLPPLWGFLAGVGGLYDYRNLVSLRRSLQGLLACGAVVLVCYVLVYFFLSPKGSLPRGVVLYHAFFSVGLVGGWRYLLLSLHRNPLFRRRCAVVAATAEEREAAVSFLKDYPFYEVVGASADEPWKIAPTDGSPPLDLPSFVEAFDVQELVITGAAYSDPKVTKAIVSSGEKGVTICPFPLLYEELTGRVPLDHLREGWWYLLPLGGEKGAFYPLVKRIGDILGATVGLCFLGLILPWVAIAIKLDSKGPVFYRQQRVGGGGKTFTVWKLRTMRADAERGKAVWAQEGDPRVTRIGRWLRKTRLDEFPQCWNILKGDMSIIGPRPERPEFVEELREAIPFFELRHSVKPGMAGWAMVNHGYVTTVEDAKVRLEYDLYYLKHQSLSFDALIFVRALLQLLLLKGR